MSFRMQLEYWQLLIGTLSGFIIAFLAEPIKTFFTSRAEKASLREAIYREIASNYLLLHSIKKSQNAPEGLEDKVGIGSKYILKNLHQECYQHILKENPVDLYQLEEALALVNAYAKLSAIIDFIDGQPNQDNEVNNMFGEFVSVSMLNL